MNITPKAHKNLQILFLAIVAASAITSIINNYEEHKLRKLRKKELEDKLNIPS